MSDRAYIFNPTNDRLAATGNGFQFPKVSQSQMMSIALAPADAGTVVFNFTDGLLYVWNGYSWSPFSVGNFQSVSQTTVAVNGNNVPVVSAAGPGTLYREIVIQNRGIYPVFILYGSGANVSAANGELVLAAGFLPDDGTSATLNVDGYMGAITAASSAACNLSVIVLQ